MIETDHYVRFERVEGVEETERGLLATLHGERLRLDVVRDDVLRIKISRGGAEGRRRTELLAGRDGL